MRAVIQRVTSCSVTVENIQISSIGPGLLILLGVTHSDEPSEAEYLADKIANLRIFEDSDGKMNRSLIDIGGEILVVSQFTLYGDCRKGRRPSFIEAASPEKAEKLYEYFTEQIRKKGIPAQSGQFRAMMKVELVNDGPVTIIIESKPMAS
jgi:D-tyrosyl-tRNA(Tyr) deacylase